MIDWSDMKPMKRKPTKKERALFNRWVTYLKDSRLPESEIYSRAASYTEQQLKPED